MTTSPRNRFIVAVTTAYTLLGLAWIFLSDQLLSVFTDVSDVVWLSSAKGVFFVLATAGLFFIALRALPHDHATGGTIVSHRLSAILQPRKLAGWTFYGFAGVITVAMLAIQHSLASADAGHVMLVLFVLPIVLSALLGGLGPGLLAPHWRRLAPIT